MKLKPDNKKQSKIEWTGRTWELTEGCSRVSAECINCYAEYLMATRLRRFGLATYDSEKGARWTGEVNARPDRLNHWRTWRSGPELVFVCSRSDLFHPKIDRGYLFQVFAEFGCAGDKGHTFQVLTKRPERAAELLPGIYADLAAAGIGNGQPWPNVWIGTSIGDNQNLAARLAALEAIPAACRWVSAEPLLENIADGMREQMDRGFIDWVVAGGETARPMSKARKSDKSWFKDLRDLCVMYRVAFYFKQWGNYGHTGELGTKQDNGRMLEGEDHKAYPVVEGQPNWNTLFEKRYALRGRLAQITE